MSELGNDTLANPKALIFQISSGLLLSRVLAVVAELGVADHLAVESRSADDLAASVNADARSLYRLLRLLASKGIFSEDEEGLFHLTDSAHYLRSDVEGSLRNMVRADFQTLFWDAYRELPHAVETGGTAFAKAFGAEFFDYLSDNPEAGALFDAAMAISSEPENASIAEAYDFSHANKIVDVGGGRGGLLTAILSRYPNARGILFDQAQVLEEPTNLAGANLLDRCDLAAGDFFKSIVAGGDVYLLKRVLHDWDDKAAIQILKQCASVMTQESRLVVVDAVIKPGNHPDPNKSLDVSIMALCPGRERTEKDFHDLFLAAGLEIVAISETPPPSTLSIIEGKLAP